MLRYGTVWRTCYAWRSADLSLPSSQAASPRFGFYYPALKPFVHYVPFMTNHSDDLVDVSGSVRT